MPDTALELVVTQVGAGNCAVLERMRIIVIALAEFTQRAWVSLEIICPQCESDDALCGEPLDDGHIRLTCDACRITWECDPLPKCPICGGEDLYHRPQVILEKSKGTQMSVQGIHVEYGRWACEPPKSWFGVAAHIISRPPRRESVGRRIHSLYSAGVRVR